MKDKMKNIHVLPTDKPSRLYLGNNGNFVFGMIQTSIQSKNDDFTNQNIYITNDEDINENDYIITKDGRLVQVSYLLSKDLQGASKVVLTDNQDLIKDGVQEIPEYFLIHYIVGNNPIEYVEIKEHLESIDTMKINYELIIPKEEPKKVLTEEDIWSKEDIDVVTDYINKEQQKQHLIDMMESDEELGLYDEKIEDIELEEVIGSRHCQFSVVENKLAIIYRNQLKILQAIKMLNNGKRD
jgi:hypothetical protein